MDVRLDDVFLVGSHDCAADPSVVRLRPQVPLVRGVTAVFERDEMVLFRARHVGGMRNTPGDVEIARPRIDESSPGLMDCIPIFPELLLSMANC